MGAGAIWMEKQEEMLTTVTMKIAGVEPLVKEVEDTA